MNYHMRGRCGMWLEGIEIEGKIGKWHEIDSYQSGETKYFLL
jgi:hypothetical protein